MLRFRASAVAGGLPLQRLDHISRHISHQQLSHIVTLSDDINLNNRPQFARVQFIDTPVAGLPAVSLEKV